MPAAASTGPGITRPAELILQLPTGFRMQHIEKSDERIRFGTSGWRGLLGEDITFPSLAALCHAVARWTLAQDRGRRVVVGFDTRLMSERMAMMVTAILKEDGCQVLASHHPIATPVLTHAITAHSAAAGVMVTASHNPPEYHGVKVFGAWGGSIGDDDAHQIESWAAEALSGHAPDRELPDEPDPMWSQGGSDFSERYLDDLAGILDPSMSGRNDFRVVYDAMHGVGAGLLDRVLERLGVSFDVLRGGRDPGFGGRPPDPIAPNLKTLSRSVRRTVGPCLGVATDGDGDRFAVVEPGGRLLTETESLSLLVDHLARTGRLSNGIAIGSATGSLVARVAESHGLSVTRHPIGFKYLSLSLLRGEAELAGDESGGFALASMGRDKDGLLASALFVEMMSTEPGRIGSTLRRMAGDFGPLDCGRRALPAQRSTLGALEVLRRAPPERLGEAVVREVDLREGLRLELPDGFVLCRASGTEPRIRIYAEAPGRAALEARLDLIESVLRKSAST